MSSDQQTEGGVSRARLDKLTVKAARRYTSERPKSRKALRKGGDNFLNGLPMHWMQDWPQPFPLVIDHAKDATLTDLDGQQMDDFCLGDSGAMFGHSPEPLVRAIRSQSTHGLTYLMPDKAMLEAGALLSRHWGSMHWQIATTTSDANRNALRVARAVTGRPKILVFNGCYHGSVEDTMAASDGAGRTVPRAGLVGQTDDLSSRTVVVEFNDLQAVRAALETGSIAAVLTEPVMASSAMVLPNAGFHDDLRKLTREHGALLIIDETHSQSIGPGGYTREHGLSPDILVVGKCVAGGMPTAAWGLSASVASALEEYYAQRPPGLSGMGTTLSANAMQAACLVATLKKIATPKAFARMNKAAARLEAGLVRVLQKHNAPWHVVRVGARLEIVFSPKRLRNGAEAMAAAAPALAAALHLLLLNEGCIIAPFHSMMLVSPVTRNVQIDRLIAAFDKALTALFKD